MSLDRQRDKFSATIRFYLKEIDLFGVLNINKPAGVTSRDVVNRVCSMAPRKTKVGHCGTLDPMATGVLIVCVGPATRLIQFGQNAEKRYVGDFRLGLSSDTEDITGNVQAIDGPVIEASQMEAVLNQFTGQISQLPPNYSALRVNGQRAYKLARKGADVPLEPRPVDIHSVTLTKFAYPDFQLSIRCGSGTYVRSLGRDIAASLGTHAVMTELVRTGIGPLNIEDATPMKELQNDSLQEKFLPGQILIGDMIRTPIEDVEIPLLADGNPVDREYPGGAKATGEIAGVDRQERLIAILQPWKDDLFTPKINFSKYWIAAEGGGQTGEC